MENRKTTNQEAISIDFSVEVYEVLYKFLLELLKDKEFKEISKKKKEKNYFVANEYCSFYGNEENIHKKIKQNIIAFIEKLNLHFSTVIIGFYYVDIILGKEKNLLCRDSIEMLILTCLTLAHKFNEDDDGNKKHYSEISGISNYRFYALEAITLMKLDYRCYVKRSIFLKYCEIIDKII